MTTFSDYLDSHPAAETGTLPGITAGSWVYGTFSTWIGDTAKNSAWDLLCDAKRTLDLVEASGKLNNEMLKDVYVQLAICESSDWFWWFGDYNPGHTVASFDQLYRDNLKRLYHLLDVDAPIVLDEPICHGDGNEVESGGTMRRAH
jgi:alpha-amylase/alpha-mannosidase (GH57 family)